MGMGPLTSSDGFIRVFGDPTYRPGTLRKGGKVGPGKWEITLDVEATYLQTNPVTLALPVAQVVAAEIRHRILTGGLGPARPATVRRRAYRDMQWGRGGWPVPGWGRSGKRAHQRRNWRRAKAKKMILRRFTQTRLGRLSPERYSNVYRGVESGMLANSLVAGLRPGGQGISLYFAGRRSWASATSGSAVSRVFGGSGGSSLLRGSLSSAAVRKAAQGVAEDMIATKRTMVRGALLRLMSELRAGAVSVNRLLGLKWE